jgi:hypothetical protein
MNAGPRFTVEPGHVMAFARAIGERGLTDSPPAPGTPVPATFTATDNQFDPAHMRGMRPTGPLATENTSGGSVLHAEQHFEYLEPVRVGDVLTVTELDGRAWDKPSRRGGQLRFREIIKEYRNQDDRLLVRARMVLVETDPPVGGAAE